jgi:hypothetical protein
MTGSVFTFNVERWACIASARLESQGGRLSQYAAARSPVACRACVDVEGRASAGEEDDVRTTTGDHDKVEEVSGLGICVEPATRGSAGRVRDGGDAASRRRMRPDRFDRPGRRP